MDKRHLEVKPCQVLYIYIGVDTCVLKDRLREWWIEAEECRVGSRNIYRQLAGQSLRMPSLFKTFTAFVIQLIYFIHFHIFLSRCNRIHIHVSRLLRGLGNVTL